MISTSVGIIEFSDRTKNLLDRRNVTQTDQAAFKEILNERRQQKNKSDKEFLSTLSEKDLTILKNVTKLVDININALTNEGAKNLLVLPGEEVDLNNDGIYEIGEAKTLQFPPPDAPEEVKVAFDNLSIKERLMIHSKILVLQFKANAHEDANGKFHITHPGEEGYVNIFDKPNFTYTGLVDQMLEELEFQKKYMPMNQYFENLHVLEKFKNDVNGF